jgi:hypothetical protein
MIGSIRTASFINGSSDRAIASAPPSNNIFRVVTSTSFVPATTDFANAAGVKP